MVDQIERFAPGFRERIVATSVRSPAEIEAANANYVGGDIITGANTAVQVLIRPRLTTRPLQHRDPGRLHLLRGDPARGGGARDERVQRRAVGARLAEPNAIEEAKDQLLVVRLCLITRRSTMSFRAAGGLVS